MARFVLRLLRLSANGCASDAPGLTPANGFCPSGFPTLPVARGTRWMKKALRNKRISTINVFLLF